MAAMGRLPDIAAQSFPARCEERRAGGGQDDRNRDARHGRRMTRFRSGFAWIVVGLLVFTLVATLVLEGIA